MVRLSFRQLLRGLDLGLLTVTLVLVLFGLAALYSFAINIAQPDYGVLIRQSVFAIIGFGLVLIMMRIDYRLWGGLHWTLYAIGLALLVAVLFFGATIRGTTGWFEFGLFQFQPVEVCKLIMVVTLAKYLSDHAAANPWRLMLVSGALTAVPAILVMLQPDTGSAMMLIGIWIVMLFVSPFPKRTLVGLGFGLIAIGAVAWLGLLQEYQQERIMNVLNPGRDPLGTGYNVRQSITAIGAGQLFGRGLGLGTQSQLQFLPERQTDFIFASIAEELGLVGSLTVVVLFGLFFWRLAQLVGRIREAFSFMVVIGLSAMFFLQTAVNLLMNLGLFPVTGLPLPFLSYGGSSLLASLMAVGILESIILRLRTAPL